MGGNDYPQVKDLQGIPFHQPLRLTSLREKNKEHWGKHGNVQTLAILVETPRKINIETVCEGSGVSSTNPEDENIDFFMMVCKMIFLFKWGGF